MVWNLANIVIRCWTGVGSRSTPPEILTFMWVIAQYLQREGFTLRSGGAKGADSAFESGAGPNKEIFYAKDACQAAMAIAAQFHPAWGACSDYPKKLHGRNAFQVLGRHLSSPSEFLICWTPDGCKSHATRTRATGGTGTAISIADAYGVPVYNLAVEADREYWQGIINMPQPKDTKLRTIYTSHYRYGGPDRTDITAKGQDVDGKAFAPTRDMVMGINNGTMSEKEYLDRYWDQLNNRIPTKSWDWLLSAPERTFVCFCNEPNFCHRNILSHYILQEYPAVRWGGWKNPA